MTVLEVLQSTTAYFEKRGVESPRLNAEHLLAFILKRKRIELYPDFELTEAEFAPLRERPHAWLPPSLTHRVGCRPCPNS